jgi:hypothetical protein
MFAIEEYDGKQPTNPHWNKASDTLDTLNHKLHLGFTRAILAAVASFASK